jgi:hypothetical protein
VRISVDDAAEVVWCRRIDPARAVVQTVPFPSSGHRYGDIVLHDGAPNGERVANGRVYRVFDELERWRGSEIPTVAVRAKCATEADAQALLAAADVAGMPCEDWTASVRMLCKACSEGRPHDMHDRDGGSEWQPERSIAFAAQPARVKSLLEEWSAAGSGRGLASAPEVF